MKICVSKIQAARRQLLEAINLFFEERDPVAVHTLVGASLNILHDHFDIDAAWDSNLMLHPESIYIKDEYRKEWLTLIRDAKNFFNIAIRSPLSLIVFVPNICGLYIKKINMSNRKY